MTFDIGLGEQHKLNSLQQRGTRKASWDGLGKYTEFYPVIGTIGSNTSKCDLCCQMKDILYLVDHFRLTVCSLHHAFHTKTLTHKSLSDQAQNPVLLSHATFSQETSGNWKALCWHVLLVKQCLVKVSLLLSPTHRFTCFSAFDIWVEGEFIERV